MTASGAGGSECARIRAFAGLAAGTGYGDWVLGGRSLVARLTSRVPVFVPSFFPCVIKPEPVGGGNLGGFKDGAGMVVMDSAVRQPWDTRYFELGHGNADQGRLCLATAVD